MVPLISRIQVHREDADPLPLLVYSSRPHRNVTGQAKGIYRICGAVVSIADVINDPGADADAGRRAAEYANLVDIRAPPLQLFATG